MKVCLNKDIEAWEGEGGATLSPLDSGAAWMSGTASQVEWAQRIKRQVAAEFDRVAGAFQSVSETQTGNRRSYTEAILTILESKRVEVLARQQAGYFIRDWQEISDQVRQMIFADARYQALKSNRAGPQEDDPDYMAAKKWR